MNKWFLPPLVAAALAAVPAAAQRPIVPGEVTRGALTSDDPQLADDTYYDDWTFVGRRGETVIVSMESRAFDAFLYLGTLRRGVFQQIQTDDDGGNGTNARLEVQLPEDGTYVIRASSLNESLGQYTLTLTGGRAGYGPGRYDEPAADPYRPVRPGPGSGRAERAERGAYLSAGRSYYGRLYSGDPTLDNGAFFHTFRYAGRRGERVTLTLRGTGGFDPYLVLGTAGGRHGVQSALARDDDGAGGRDARIVYTFPNDGDFVIRVQSLLPASGEYTLDVESSLGGYSGRPGGTGYEDQRGDEYDGEALDQRLVGRWGLTLPGARVQQDDWASASASASLGILTVDEEGAYTWRKNGRTLRGQLLPYTPRRDAQPGVRYYAINDGRDEFYVFFTSYRGQRYMQVNSRATHQVVAYGYRDGGMR